MKRVAKFREGGSASSITEVTPPFVLRRQAREEAARAAEAEDDGRGARRERLRNFFRLGPRTQEEADILEAYRTNRDVSEIRREREAGGRAVAPAPAPAPAAPAPAAPSRGRQVQPPPRTAPAMPAPTADYEERMRRGSLPAGRSAAPGPMGDYSERAAAGTAARPRPAQRQAPRPRYSEADIARIRSVMEGGDIQPEQPGFFERMGIRRTNETGEGAPSTGSLRGDLQALGRSLGFKKGGAIKGKGMHMMPDGSMMKNKDHAAMKKGNKAMMYREGGKVRQGMQSPKAQEARAEMAEDVMRRERAREPISDKERKAGRVEAAMDSGPLTDAEKERMRSSGFKKGGMIKPKTAMKKGGAVKAPAKKMAHGGKVHGPKKMMKGGMTSKPKKMMGGGRAMYAKGGMAKGCK